MQTGLAKLVPVTTFGKSSRLANHYFWIVFVVLHGHQRAVFNGENMQRDAISTHQATLSCSVTHGQMEMRI
jgi:hypothetical protein